MAKRYWKKELKLLITAIILTSDRGYLGPLQVENNHFILSAVVRRTLPRTKLEVVISALAKLAQAGGHPPAIVPPIRFDPITNYTALVSRLDDSCPPRGEMDSGSGDGRVVIVVSAVRDSVRPEPGPST